MDDPDVMRYNRAMSNALYTFEQLVVWLIEDVVEGVTDNNEIIRDLVEAVEHFELREAKAIARLAEASER